MRNRRFHWQEKENDNLKNSEKVLVNPVFPPISETAMICLKVPRLQPPPDKSNV